MVLGVHFAYDFLDAAFLVDFEGNTVCTHVFASVHALYDPGSLGFVDRMVLVGKQVKGQFVFVDKLLVRGRTVGADSQNAVSGLA